MMQLRPEEIGGAKVQRAFKFGDRKLIHGDTLTGDEVRSIRPTNRSSLIDKGYLMPWPKSQSAPVVATKDTTRHVVAKGFGRYDVIEGRILNTDGRLTKEAAYALAGLPLPDTNGGDTGHGAPN